MPWPPRSMLPPPRRPSHPDDARRPAVARRRTLRPPRKASDRSPRSGPRPVVAEQDATCDVDGGSALVGQSAAGEHIANEVRVAGLTLRARTHHARRPASVRFGPRGPALRAPRLGIIRLLRQFAVLRSNAAKQDLEVLPVSAGCASLVRRRPAQITSRFVRVSWHRRRFSNPDATWLCWNCRDLPDSGTSTSAPRRSHVTFKGIAPRKSCFPISTPQ